MTTQMTFSDISKICMIDQDMYQTTFGYAPDESRWKTVLEKNCTTRRAMLCGGDYERVTQNSTYIPLLAVTDLEMLPEYDPLLGRFLSPDRSALCDAFVTTWRKSYVQQPDNSQSFNRYSYCLNNPLKYTDPDGEFLHLIFGAIIGGTVNWATHGCKFNAKGLGYFGVGALAGAAIGGVAGGIDAITDGRNFMHGGRITDDVSIEMPFMEQGGEYDCRYEVFRSNDMYFNGKTLRVSELRQLYPNVEIDDLQMAKMYDKIGSLAIERIPVSDLSKTDIAKAMIDNVAQRHTII